MKIREKTWNIIFGESVCNKLSAKLRAYAPYPSLIRAYAILPSSIGALPAFVLLQLRGKVCFVCALQLIIHPRPLFFLFFILRQYTSI